MAEGGEDIVGVVFRNREVGEAIDVQFGKKTIGVASEKFNFIEVDEIRAMATKKVVGSA